jgi:hypothetical protein
MLENRFWRSIQWAPPDCRRTLAALGLKLLEGFFEFSTHFSHFALRSTCSAIVCRIPEINARQNIYFFFFGVTMIQSQAGNFVQLLCTPASNNLVSTWDFLGF